MDNEPDRKWNREMCALLQEMIHYRKGLKDSENADPQAVSGYEERYRKILEMARTEYEDIPPQ